jgi:lipoyl(octanoyl) transferase
MSSEVETSLTVSVARLQHGQTIVSDSSTSVGMTEKLFSALEVYRDNGSRSAALNMAIDEALLEIAVQPTIRFYRWDHPALSFGYFGKFEDVASHQPEHDIVRRWTGGGIVFHGDDLTYSVVIPAADSAFGESSMSIYEQIHRAIRTAFAANGKSVELAAVTALDERRPEKASAVTDRRYRREECFANPVRADVLSSGRKIAGAAQRRTRRGLLQQGSIQDVDLSDKFADQFANQLCSKCCQKTLDEHLIARANEIAEEKYGTEMWLRKR